MDIHPIDTWNRLIYEEIAPGALTGTDRSPTSYFEGFSSMVFRAKQDLRLSIDKEILSSRSESLYTVLQGYHLLVVNFLDVLYHYYQKSVAPDIKAFYSEVIENLKEVYDHLITNLPIGESRVPLVILFQFETTQQPVLQTLKEQFLRCEKNHQLVEAVFSGLQDYLSPGSSVLMTYRQIQYFKMLAASLSKITATNQADDKYSPLIENLIAHQYNEPIFLTNLVHYIQDDLREKDELEQVNLWKAWKQSTFRIVEHTMTPFLIDCPSPKAFILDWISSELDLLESLPKEKNKPAVPTAKINTSLSVPVLALYIRLFKEAGIITNENSSEMFRTISSVFTTHRKADVTTTHLHSKFYAVEESAKRKVFDQLMKMAHLCKRIA